MEDFAGTRVLIVEDEMLVAMLLEGMLQDLGCEIVATAARPAQAMAAIEAHSLDIAMLDLNLDGQPSDSIADALMERGIPIVFSTGYGDTCLKEAYRAWPLLTKPFPPEDLEGALLRVLRP